jgi:heme a synthase
VTAPDPNPCTPRWLHWCAVLTVVLTLPLLTLGAEVTTKKVGMIDQEPVRSPLHLVQTVHDMGGLSNVLQEMGLGWVIEHGHRTISWLVGFLAIGLAIGLAKYEPRRWLRLLGLAVPFAVLAQGILGMLRVEMDRRFSPTVGGTIALIHGCTAQLVFAFLVSIAVWTSEGWWRQGGETRSGDRATTAESVSVCRASLVLVGVMYLQIIFGAVMRHKELALGTRMHILLAFAVVAAAIWVGVVMLQSQPAGTLGRRAVWTLWGLLVIQLMLGLETMLSKFSLLWGYTGQQVEPMVQAPDLIRSIHFLVGALTFSAAVALALIAHRHVAWAMRPAAAPRRQLEGVL